MKIKSIVLAAALATAFSAFSETVNSPWFVTNDTRIVYFDTAVGTPVEVGNSVAPASGATVTGYAISAHVTNLVVFADKPAPATLKNSTSIKGAICAAYDSTVPVNKWYGLKKNGSGEAEWTELTGTEPTESGDYIFRMEFGTSTVTYKVFTISSPDTPIASSGALNRFGTADFAPALYAFAGMGGCTNIVGEYEVTIPENHSAVEVDDAGGKIIIDAKALEEIGADDVKTAQGENGLKKWVNYVLGLPNNDANAKPFAAPEQNSTADKLTFSLGGVDNVLGETATGAKVTYTVETLINPSTVDTQATEPTPVNPGSSISVDVPSEVKYYRIKIKIDPAH